MGTIFTTRITQNPISLPALRLKEAIILPAFWLPDHKPPIKCVDRIRLDDCICFNRDWSKVAKKGEIEMMELELKKLYDTVSSIHDEMFHLREREEEMQQLNRVTNSKMAAFSFLSLAVCFLAAGLQLWHLKTFFERKKLV